MPKTYDETIREITDNYLATLDPDNPKSPEVIKSEMLDNETVQMTLENKMRSSGERWRIPKNLLPVQIAQILLHLHHIVRIGFSGASANSEYDMLGLYQTEGPDVGLYSTDKDLLSKLIQQYDYTITSRGIDEVTRFLNIYAPRMLRSTDKDMIAVNNGIFDFKNKKLMPFSPDFVFTAKSRVDYNPNAVNVVIHNNDDNTDWDVESWIQDLFDDDELSALIWELLGSILRPNVPWNKSAWFVSDTGNNGKGSLCELMRNLTGEGTYAPISLENFNKEFHLEPLLKANAVIVDENSVGIFIERADNLKAAITGDVLLVNRKFQTPVSLQFRGMIIQCVNEIPRVKDRSSSFMRRLLFVPFTKCFTGTERKYIKEDYLKRKEVLEYVLLRVMNMNNYELSYPAACKQMMDEFRVSNDPVSQFTEEMLPQCQWDFIPNQFLYELYLAWLRENCPSSSPLNKTQFLREIRRILETSKTWFIPQGSRKPGGKMNKTEPLIHRYKLTNWYNPLYIGNDINKLCHPVLPENARGIQRKKT